MSKQIVCEDGLGAYSPGSVTNNACTVPFLSIQCMYRHVHNFADKKAATCNESKRKGMLEADEFHRSQC